MQGVEVRRSADRFVTVAPARPDAAEGWALTRHSFSFGEHYDPDNVGFAALVALNDETVRAGEAYPEHVHRDVEIVTWVLDGTLVHTDSTGTARRVGPGTVQRLSAGSGVRHSEGAAPEGPVRFVQTWVRPDAVGGAPAYARATVDPAELADGWSRVVGSGPTAALDLRSRGTALWVTRLAPGGRRALPGAPRAYVLVARGAVEVDDVGRLAEGEALALARPAPLALVAQEPAELLVWTFA